MKPSAGPASPGRIAIRSFFKISAALVLLGAGEAGAANPTAPTGLLAGGQVNPPALDLDGHSFSWVMHDADRGEVQTAYQILVSSTPNGSGDVWDSGTVASSASSSVPYAGPALAPATRYWWKVRIWDRDGGGSPVSAEATFDTGLRKSDWTARFIWDSTGNTNSFAYLRKTFTVSKPVRRAKVYASAHNDYLLHCNGVALGFGPARSNPGTYGQYVGYDITPQIVQGSNVLAAAVHWHGVFGNSGINEAWGFILECRIDFEDGTTMTVKSDATWKALAVTPFIEGQPTYFGGFAGTNNRAAIRYDARREPAGWTTAAFDDSSWAAATVVDRPDFNFFAQRCGNEIEEPEIEPVSVVKSGADWVVDFGKCVSGWPQITVRDQAPGTVIRLNYFQIADGVNRAGWDEYTCKGGTETWRANFGRYTSFKAIRITGLSGSLQPKDVRAIISHTAMDVGGSFDCSSPMLNEIFEMCERSARQNIQQGFISVDANREQSQWTADSYNIGAGLLYSDRHSLILDKVVRDFAGEQMADGRFYAVSPARFSEIPEWSMYWAMMLWQQYLFNADTKLLADMWAPLTKWMQWLEPHTQASGLIDIGNVWRIADYAGGIMENEGQNIALNALYYRNLQIAAQIAAILGHDDEAARWQARAVALKDAINANLFDGSSYLTRIGSPQRIALGSAYAMRFGLVPDADRPAVAAWLRGQAAHVGGYGGATYYHGAYEAGGLGDLLVSDLIRYQFMLTGNRTNWEYFGLIDAEHEPNHAWTSYPTDIFLSRIAGIQPTSPAFATFSIKPETKGLTYAQGVVPSVRGDITTRWEWISPGELRLRCVVPANTTALVHIPVDQLRNVSISEGGSVIWAKGNAAGSANGVAYDGDDDRYVRFRVGSGTYSFVAAGTPGLPAPLSVIADNDKPSVTFTGGWTNNTADEMNQRYELSQAFAPVGDGSSTAVFRPNLPTGGLYKVYARWTSHPNRATNAPYTVNFSGGQTTIRVNQEQNGGKWMLLGTFPFDAGRAGNVVLSNDANEYVIADAVMFEPVPASLAPGQSVLVLSDTFDSAQDVVEINRGLGARQTGWAAVSLFRANANNAAAQSQIESTNQTLLLSANPGQAPAGEALAVNLTPFSGGRLVIQFDARCRTDNGDAARWVSLSVSDQPFAANPTVTDAANALGVLFRANGGMQVFRPGQAPETIGTNWTANSAQRSTIKLVIADADGLKSPFLGNGSVARLSDGADNLLGTFALPPLNGGYLHLGAFESAWEIDNLKITTEIPGTAFQTWINGHFPGATDPAVVGTDADPDRDGSRNLTEFAQNGNPADGTNPGLSVSGFGKENTGDAENPFTITIAVRRGVSFAPGPEGVQQGASIADGVSYAIQGSRDLHFPSRNVEWVSSSDAPPAGSGLPSLAATAWTYQTFRLAPDAAMPNQGFLRVRISEPNAP